MPKQLILLPEKYERAVNQLEEVLVKQLTARSLSKSELVGAYKQRSFTRGWQIPVAFPNGEQKINLLLTGEFPFAPPVFALADAPTPLTYPHVEEDGILCLLPDSASVSPHQPVEVAKALLIEAVNLVDDCLSKRNQEDFRREFHSYWNRFLSAEKTKFVSLLNPKPPSRIVRVWKGNGITIFGEEEEALAVWLQNSFGKKNYNLEPSAFLWLSETMVPCQYPKMNSDVAKIARRQTKNGTLILSELIYKTPNQISILLGSETDTGVCLAGIVIRKPQSSSNYSTNVKNPLERGFRRGNTPPAVLTGRYLQSSSMAVRRYQVERADAAWIHGRGQDARQPDLSQATITVVGCGSVGSPVAKLLAQSGVGKIRLIDPQALNRANTGRHALGARYSGCFKAESLARELSENYPHITIEYRAVSWETVARTEPEIFTSSNLIVSAVGDWTFEGALNEWQRKIKNFPPILYGWTENFACAGHAVAIFRNGDSCLQCGMSEEGVPVFRATQWKDQTILKQEPACGVMFQPYGPVELNHTVTLVAELALDIILKTGTPGTHRAWACRRSLLESAGGEWTAQWLHESNDNVEGGCMMSRIWTKRNSCESCGEKDY